MMDRVQQAPAATTTQRDDVRPREALSERVFAPVPVSSFEGCSGRWQSTGVDRAGASLPVDRLSALRRSGHSEESGIAPNRSAGPALAALRRSAAGAGATARHGRPLPTATLRAMESTLGADLSTVRISRGRPAHLGALASTSGEQITLGPDRSLDDPAARPLLAHELTHVLQHRAGRVNDASRPELESEADAVARAFASGRQVPLVAGVGLAPAAAERTIELYWGWPAAAVVGRWYIKKCVQKYVMWKAGDKIGDELEAITDQAIANLHKVVDPVVDTSKELIETIKLMYSLKRAIETAVEFTTSAMVAPAAMALADWVGVEDPEFVQLIAAVVAKTTARMATWLIFDRQMQFLAQNVDVMVQQARKGAVQPALGMADKVASGSAYFDYYRTFDHYAFLRFLYKEKPGSAVELVQKTKGAVLQADSALSGFSLEARTLAKKQIASPTVLSSVGFSVLGEAAYGGMRVWQGKETASTYTGGKYLTRGVGAGLGQYTMTALANWGVPLLTSAGTGPVVFIPPIVMGAVGAYLGRKLLECAYESAPGLWASFSAWMWPATGGGGGGGNLQQPGSGARSTSPTASPRTASPLRPTGPSADEGSSKVVIPSGPTTQLSAVQIQAVLLALMLRRPNTGLFVPIVPTWQVLINSGLGGPAVGLAMGLTGWPVQKFVPTSLAKPQILEQVGHYPPIEIEEIATGAQSVEPKTAEQGLNQSQEELVGVASGKALSALGELLIASQEVLSETRQ